MQKVRFIGLDVHKDSITVAVADGTGPAEVVGTIANEMGAVLKRLKKVAEGRPAIGSRPTGGMR